MAKDQYVEIILQTNEWFENRIKQLKLLIDETGDKKILFEGKGGEKVELPDEMKKGFILGIKTAIEIFGEFPVKISKTNEGN